LIVAGRPEGRKYAAAKNWGVFTVTLEWLNQSSERGMILDERYFDPLLPAEERGVGAWVKSESFRISLGKRSRSETTAKEEGQRKLRKTASMRLNSQRDDLWGDILRPQALPPNEAATMASDHDTSVQEPAANLAVHAPAAVAEADGGIFSTCFFYQAGFDARKSNILTQAVEGLGGFMCGTQDEAALKAAPREPWHRFIIVPQDSQPESHPIIQYENLDIVTEFFVEMCIHHRTFFNPNDHVLGCPFPRFPVEGFEQHVICSAGLTGIELLHVDKAVAQLGGKFQDRLRESTTLLICESPHVVRKEKLNWALEHGVPIVAIDWLWDCISTGYNVPVEKHMFPELKQAPRLHQARDRAGETKKQPQRSKTDPTATRSSNHDGRRLLGAGVDKSVFDGEAQLAKKPATTKTAKEVSNASTHFETARTHQDESSSGGATISRPLSEVSGEALNRSPSPRKNLTKTLKKSKTKHPRAIQTTDDDSTPRQSDDADDTNQAVEHVDAEPAEPDEPDEPEEARRQRLEEEEAAGRKRELEEQDAARERLRRAIEEQKAAERVALSTKLTSLIDAATAGSASDTPKEDDSTANSGPPRRKRQVFGRAVSNTSASGSFEVSNIHKDKGKNKHDGGEDQSSKGGSFPVLLGEAAKGRGDRGDGDASTAMAESAGDGAVACAIPGPPPATQLGYQDIEAERHREEMLRKMMGGDSGDVGTSTASRASRRQAERITFADVGGLVEHGSALPPRRQTRQGRRL
jgi:DNA replication regulator DPB11